MQVTPRPVLVAFALLLPGAVLAQERPWPVLERMGVTGTWSVSCSAGASKTNTVSTYYTEKQGLVRRRYDRGPEAQALNVTIDAAQQLGPTRLRMRQRQDDPNWGASNGVVFDMVAEIAGGRIRLISMTRGDGTAIVKDGIVVATGKPSPDVEKCGN